MSKKNIYKGLDAYSQEMGLSKNSLIEAFKIENHFHKLLKNEKNAFKREILYKEFYSKLLTFYGRISPQDSSSDEKLSLKNKHVRLFEKEIINKSVIDFGCGEGFFF
jgi:uncharacterized protein YutD